MEVPKEVPNDTKPEAPQTAQDYMGYSPDLFDAKDEAGQETPTPKEATPSTQDLINSTLKDIKVGEDGKFIYPEGITPELKAAVAATKSFRDTQSSFTKSQQELKASQAEAKELKERLAAKESPTSGLTSEEATELAELKFTNPDLWYTRMRALESTHADRVSKELDEVTEKARERTAGELRKEALEEYNKNAEKPLTNEQLMQETPPSWQQAVIDGSLSFDDFLSRADKLIHAGKVVKNTAVDNPTDLTKVTGGTKDPEIKEPLDYAKMTF